MHYFSMQFVLLMYFLHDYHNYNNNNSMGLLSVFQLIKPPENLRSWIIHLRCFQASSPSNANKQRQRKGVMCQLCEDKNSAIKTAKHHLNLLCTDHVEEFAGRQKRIWLLVGRQCAKCQTPDRCRSHIASKK